MGLDVISVEFLSSEWVKTPFFAPVAMRFHVDESWNEYLGREKTSKTLKRLIISVLVAGDTFQKVNNCFGNILYVTYGNGGPKFQKYFSEDGMLRVWRWRQGWSSWYSKWAAKISRMHWYFMLCNLYGVYSILGFYFSHCLSKRKSIPGLNDKDIIIF